MGEVTVYRDRLGEWRWRREVSSDQVAESGEGYKNKADAVEQAEKNRQPEDDIVVIDVSIDTTAEDG
jgi:uncharacterized protein YegP (UPF0339 family)